MSSLPATLGKYQIIREIARSNDIVYEAYDSVMNRRVAVKELALLSGASAAQREDRQRRFLREAKAAGSLAHPNIVTIYEYGQEADHTFLAMEFLDGHTLRNEVDQSGVIPQDRALEIAAAVLSALDYAHQHGVIHRDIKPDNIQLLADGRIKLTDFGIARLTFEPNLTIDGQIFGTPSYMSPEQIVGKEIDARSDLFSVGVALYEMLAGKKPFGGDSVVSITYAIMNNSPEQLTGVSWPIWNVIERALDKTPGMRYASASEMKQALEQAVEASRNPVLDHAPMAASYTPSPATYAYNPYQAPTPPPVQLVAGPNGQPMFNVGGTMVPTYYPPPPRQPLMKPETKVFLGRFLIAFIVMGTLLGLVLVGVNSMSTVLQRMSQQQSDCETRDRLITGKTGLSLDERIVQFESYIRGLQSPEMVAEEKKNLAVLHEQRGNERIRAGDYLGAENDFETARDLDPSNAAYASSLANLYATTANQNQGEARTLMLRESALAYKQAVEHAPDPQRRQTYARGAAISLYNYAQSVAAQDPVEARTRLYEARDLAEPNSEVAANIRNLLDRLTRE